MSYKPDFVLNYSGFIGSEKRYDAVLIGAGIMSATLAVLLCELDPDIRVLIIERLENTGMESSSALNNAGTGHAGNCELNYTPIESNGFVNISKALAINRAFELSLEFWASLTAKGNGVAELITKYLNRRSCWASLKAKVMVGSDDSG